MITSPQTLKQDDPVSFLILEIMSIDKPFRSHSPFWCHEGRSVELPRFPYLSTSTRLEKQRDKMAWIFMRKGSPDWSVEEGRGVISVSLTFKRTGAHCLDGVRRIRGAFFVVFRPKHVPDLSLRPQGTVSACEKGYKVSPLKPLWRRVTLLVCSGNHRRPNTYETYYRYYSK